MGESALVIQTNILAMNANRQFGLTQTKQRKSAEKLSSGYRINRAADDAAGLTISEKMRRQIRGLNQASDNAQDGISMVQTAEGALNEVHDMLHRVNELCVQAANGTLTYEDRSAIQDEIYQLTDEIDRVGDATTFNTIKLLSGLPQPRATAVNPPITINGAAGTVTQATLNPERDAYYQINPLELGNKVSIMDENGKTSYYKASTKGDIDAYESTWAQYRADKSSYDAAKRAYETEKSRYDAEKAAYDKAVEDKKTDPSVVVPDDPGDPPVFNRVEPTEPPTYDGTSDDKAKLIEIPDLIQKIASGLLGTNASANADIAEQTAVTYSRNGNDGIFKLHFYGPLPVSLQVGTEKDHTIDFKLGVVNAASLGIFDINVKDMDGSGARDGMDKVKEAISRTSSERSKLGAVQNRLEHTIKNLDNIAENTQAAESVMRDTDMADEMVRYSNANIIAQAGQSMITQANQSNQGVLNLLG